MSVLTYLKEHVVASMVTGAVTLGGGAALVHVASRDSPESRLEAAADLLETSLHKAFTDASFSAPGMHYVAGPLPASSYTSVAPSSPMDGWKLDTSLSWSKSGGLELTVHKEQEGLLRDLRLGIRRGRVELYLEKRNELLAGDSSFVYVVSDQNLVGVPQTNLVESAKDGVRRAFSALKGEAYAPREEESVDLQRYVVDKAGDSLSPSEQVIVESAVRLGKKVYRLASSDFSKMSVSVDASLQKGLQAALVIPSILEGEDPHVLSFTLGNQR